MTGTAEHKPLEPNAKAMRDYVELLFGGDRCAGMLNGLIELAYTGHDGKPSRAHHFRIDELDELVDLAVKLNRNEGINVYVSPTLRRPDIKHLHKRTTKADLLGCTSLWADLDDEGVAQAMKERARFCLPSLVVVTGRKPFLRAQAIWRIDEPMTDIGEIEAALRSIQVALGGDPAVVDASRVMRLPGSIAHPTKDGRVTELTELITRFEIDRPSIYPTGQVCRAFKPQSAGGEVPDPERAGAGAGAAGAGPADPHAKNPFTGRFDGEALLRSIRPGHWYPPMRDFTAHMVGRGRQDWEIRAMAAPHDEPGHQGITVQDLIDSARRKWNKPNPADPASEFDFSQSPPTKLAEGIDDCDLTQLALRPWLFGRWLLRGFLSLLIGSGGQGKSMVAIHIALAIAADKVWSGQHPFDGGGKVWIFNNEDDRDELYRRIGGTAMHMGIPFDDLKGRVFVNSGVGGGGKAGNKFIVAVPSGQGGPAVATPDVNAVIEEIKRKGIRLLVVDPFVSTHAMNENDNVQMEAVAAMYRTIAQEADCAVLLVHHTAKPGDQNQAGNQHAARGASSVAAAARVVLTVTGMNEADAKKLMGDAFDEEVRERCIRVDSGKGNLSAPGKHTVWLKKISVELPNGGPIKRGDEVGALSWTDFAEYQQTIKQKAQDTKDKLLVLVAQIMEDVPVGGEIPVSKLIPIIVETGRFGSKNTVRDALDEAIPMAAAGKVPMGDYVLWMRRDGVATNAPLFVCKRPAE
jgi:KaiC/GvpD/RAD55 family RecA-like ATPase